MRVLITRPQPDAETTAARLRDMGHVPLVAPLLEIRLLVRADSLDITGFQAVLVTSANGARALSDATEQRNTLVFAVGVASAETARQAGFGSVESADGDVRALKALVTERLDPGNGPLLHVTGSVTAGDLVGGLGQSGYVAEALQLYDTDTENTLPGTIEDGLRQGNIDAMLLYSPRTARTFVNLVNSAGIPDLLNNIKVFCLSNAVRDALGDAGFRSVHVAERPEQDRLLQLLQMTA